MEKIMAVSSEQFIQAQQEKTAINDLFANSVFSTALSDKTQQGCGYLLTQLHQAKADFHQYGESFDANQYKRCIQIISSCLLSVAGTLALLANVNGGAALSGLILTTALIAYYTVSHENRHNFKFLTFFKKGKLLDSRVKKYKDKLLPIVSSKEFQFKILYQLQMLGEKIGHDIPGVNQGWIMEKYNQLKLAFNEKDYEKSYTILEEIYQNHDLIHNKLLQKIDMITYEEEFKEFVSQQKSIDQSQPFEHHVQQLESLL
jgi:hypothetical protein